MFLLKQITFKLLNGILLSCKKTIEYILINKGTNLKKVQQLFLEIKEIKVIDEEWV